MGVEVPGIGFVNVLRLLVLCPFAEITVSRKSAISRNGVGENKPISLFCFHDNPLKNNIKRAV